MVEKLLRQHMARNGGKRPQKVWCCPALSIQLHGQEADVASPFKVDHAEGWS